MCVSIDLLPIPSVRDHWCPQHCLSLGVMPTFYLVHVATASPFISMNCSAMLTVLFILKILPAFLFSCPYLSCLSRWPNLSPFSALSCSFLLAFFKPIFLHFSPLPCTAVPLLPPPTPGSFQFIPPGSLLSEDSFPSFLLTYLLLRSFQCSRFRCSLKNCHLQLRDWPDWEKRGHFLGTRGENRKVALMVRKGRLCIIH